MYNVSYIPGLIKHCTLEMPVWHTPQNTWRLMACQQCLTSFYHLLLTNPEMCTINNENCFYYKRRQLLASRCSSICSCNSLCRVATVGHIRKCIIDRNWIMLSTQYFITWMKLLLILWIIQIDLSETVIMWWFPPPCNLWIWSQEILACFAT